jgi:L-asparaginase II
MKSFPPLVVEATRGGRAESRHLVDAVIADASGALHTIHGEAERPVFPRSSIKALQALPLVESGAADAFGFGPVEIALACASHHGEPMHVACAAGMLAKAGLGPQCLECGAHWPRHDRDRNALILAGDRPNALHNNCSGKHSGFLAFAAHSGMPTEGYVGLDHPVQKAIAATLTETIGAPHGRANHGIDGCSIPTYSIPLKNLAVAFARFGVGEGSGPQRSKTMLRIRDACLAHPQMVSGTGGVDNVIMAALKGRVFTKTGAEGVYVAALPEVGLGIALKAHDGASRASESAVAMLIESCLKLEETEVKALERIRNPVLANWNAIEVGEIRTA